MPLPAITMAGPGSVSIAFDASASTT